MKIWHVLILVFIIIVLFIPTFIKSQNNPKVKEIVVTPTEINPSPTLDIIVITETPIPTPTKKPTPTPTLTPTPIPAGALEDWFNKYASKESIDRERLKRIAVCESGLNSNARYRDYGGLFQFSTGSWISTRTNMNLQTDPDLRFNPEEAIKTAAFKVATEGIHAWPNCNK